MVDSTEQKHRKLGSDRSDTKEKAEKNADLATSDLKRSEDSYTTERSPYLVKRLLETDDINLFNHVKFNLVKQVVDRYQAADRQATDRPLTVSYTHLTLPTKA